MCMICNAGDAGDHFLTQFAVAQGAMRRATDAMLAASRAAPDPIVKRRYARMHKRMVRMSRDWNRLQQEREVPVEELRPAALHLPDAPPLRSEIRGVRWPGLSVEQG